MTEWLVNFIQNDAFVIMMGSVLLIGAFEFFWGVKPQTLKHWSVNMGFGTLYAALGLLLAPAIGYALSTAVNALGGGLIDLTPLAEKSTLAADLLVVFVSTFVFDFFFYWVHRLEHANRFLWQQHIVHHSDRSMAASTGALTSAAEVVLIPLLVGLPMAVLFKLPAAHVAVLNVLPLTWLYVQHANLNISLGPFWWVLVSPNFHRIHHSVETKHFDKNFALWFPLLDIVFKTSYRPAVGEIPETGVEGVHINSVHEAFLFPFKKWFGF